MIGLELSRARSAPAGWWPAGASLAADFIAGRYMRAGRHAGAADAFSYARAGAAWAQRADGTLAGFGAHAPRRTDLGLLLEPESENLVIRSAEPDWGHPVWFPLSAGVSPHEGAYLEAFANAVSVASNGASWHVCRCADIMLSNALTYSASFWYVAGSSGRVRLNVTQAGGGISGYQGTAAAPSTPQSAAGAVSGLAIESFGAVRRASFQFSPSTSMNHYVAIGPDTATTGGNVVLLGAQLEPVAIAGSPILTGATGLARAADALALRLPAGAHELTLTFSDMSTQQISGAEGMFALDPSALNRPLVRHILAVPA